MVANNVFKEYISYILARTAFSDLSVRDRCTYHVFSIILFIRDLLAHLFSCNGYLLNQGHHGVLYVQGTFSCQIKLQFPNSSASYRIIHFINIRNPVHAVLNRDAAGWLKEGEGGGGYLLFGIVSMLPPRHG